MTVRLYNDSHFYPRSPCGERQTEIWPVIAEITISIHALLAESDKRNQLQNGRNSHFYPRSPCGERQWSGSQQPAGTTNFYPRSPCGERHILCVVSVQVGGFLSTLSLRRATQIKQTYRAEISISIHALLAESDRPIDVPQYQILDISIHALLAESDEKHTGKTVFNLYFYPRSPCGERPEAPVLDALSKEISIHALLAESDRE